MNQGRYFEDFTLGETINHGTGRTISEGDNALYMGLYGGRFAPQASREAAQSLGYRDRVVDDWLVFHIVFGKSVPDISRNAIANLGYAHGRWHAPVYAGDTLNASSTIIGIKPNRDGKSGIVYVQTSGHNQHATLVLDYVRWVMLPRLHPTDDPPETHIPPLESSLNADTLIPPPAHKETLTLPRNENDRHDTMLAHGDGITIENTDHMLATRLYQNTARVHFDEYRQKSSRFGTRLVYGGHVISLARSLSFNGLASAYAVAGLNGGRHVAPVFAGDTLYCWSAILETVTMGDNLAALRVRHIMCKDSDTPDAPLDIDIDARDGLPKNAVLDLDVWLWALK